MKETIVELTDDMKKGFYPIWYKNTKYEKLLVCQSTPEQRYWFKDKEISKESFEKIQFDICEFLDKLQSNK